MKIGILGGGQLGRMLLQQAANYAVETFVLENDAACPAAHLCHHFVQGNIQDYQTVLAFGQLVDAITIEIENVNVDALETLENEGKIVVPNSATLRTIKNKILQKDFYQQHGIPTAAYVVTQKATDVFLHKNLLPAVHKIGEGGYDGKGVAIIETEKDFGLAFNAPAVLEKKVKIKKELAIMVAVNNMGQTAIYPIVEMIFDPYLHLLDMQLCPAQLPEKTLWRVEAIAVKLVKAFKSPGLFAIEMLVDTNDDVWVNETAPRVHNSGHHTIEAHYCSQYDMLWRILLGYPLGNPGMINSSSLINIIGSPLHTGEAVYEGLHDVLKMENAFVHLYGKKLTKPGRKMGHVTIVDASPQELTYRIQQVKQVLKVVTQQ